MSANHAAPIDRINVSAFKIPTDAPESDGTLAWDSTTLVLVEAQAAAITGIGYSYANTATATLIRDTLIDVVCGRDAMAVPGAWVAMVQAIRNLGRPGIASMAIAALDTALWDLKARLLNLPLAVLLGAVHEGVPIYGSGGFTSYSIAKLQQQLAGWSDSGISAREDEGRARIPIRTSSGCARRARQSGAIPSSLSTRTARTVENRRSP